MIAKIEGKLTKLDADSALVQVGSVGYEVMLPSYCINALSNRIGSARPAVEIWSPEWSVF